jgi:signal transduction histidine kinase
LKEEKERISRDLHDNIGSQLAYITSNIDYFSRKVTGSADITQKLDSLGDHVRFITQQLRDTIWAINKENVPLHDFVKRIRTYILKQIENIENLEFELKFDENTKNLILNSAKALNLFRIIQEAINNMLKHSKATRVIIEILEKEGILSVKINDNGIGFKMDQAKTESYGIENMKGRIEEIEGTFKIESTPSKGTEILLNVAIKQNTPISV